MSLSFTHSLCLRVRIRECVSSFFSSHIEYAAYVIAMCAQNVSKPYSNKMVFKVAQHIHTQRSNTLDGVLFFLHHFHDIFLLLISFFFFFFFRRCVVCCYYNLSSHWMWQLLSIWSCDFNLYGFECVRTDTRKNLQRERSAFDVRVRLCVSNFFSRQSVVTKFFQSKNALLY